MEISPPDEAELKPFVDELWVVSQREMTVDSEYTLRDEICQDGLAYYRSLLSDEDSKVFLARDGDDLVGYVTAEIRTPPPIFEQVAECHISELFVKQTARRAGIGGQLLDAITEWATERDCASLDLNVDRGNQAATALYEQHGFDTQRYNMRKELRE